MPFATFSGHGVRYIRPTRDGGKVSVLPGEDIEVDAYCAAMLKTEKGWTITDTSPSSP